MILVLIQAVHVTTIGGPYALQAFDEMHSGVLEPSVGVERAGATLVISRLEAPGVPYFYRYGLPPSFRRRRPSLGGMATTAPPGPGESFFRTGAGPPGSSHIGDGCRRAN